MDRRLRPLTWLVLAAAAVVRLDGAAAQVPEMPAPPPSGSRPADQPPAGPIPDPNLPPPDPAPGPPRKPAAPRPRRPARPEPEADRDDRARPASSPEAVPEPADGEKGPLPVAQERPGARPAGADPEPADGYQIDPEKLPLGKQEAGLSVEVIAPSVMNKGQEATLKIVARNSGVADLSTVRVHYDLPGEFQLVSATPEPKRVADEPKLYWNLNTLAAGSDQVIALRVKAVAVKDVNHAAHVTVSVGARSRTVIQEPLLRVEQSVTPRKVLKGQQVRFKIAVSNPGSGPARNVLVQAKLSSGLRSEGADIVEQTISTLQPKERFELDELVVDTVAGGEQSCTVTATSTDVAVNDARDEAKVVVLQPSLALKLDGPQTRYTDTTADYKVTVTNPGSADANNVKVAVTLPPSSGRVESKSAGGTWDAASHKLTWTIPVVAAARNGEPGKSTVAFRVRLSGIGLYQVAAETRGAGGLYAKGSLSTDVSGMADVDFEVVEQKKIMDIGETTVFAIRMKNSGTKAAKEIQVSAVLSANLDAINTAGTDVGANFNDKSGEVIFPRIDSLAPGRALELSIMVKAKDAGPASCRAFLHHLDLGDDKNSRLEDIARTRVTTERR